MQDQKIIYLCKFEAEHLNFQSQPRVVYQTVSIAILSLLSNVELSRDKYVI